LIRDEETKIHLAHSSPGASLSAAETGIHHLSESGFTGFIDKKDCRFIMPAFLEVLNIKH